LEEKKNWRTLGKRVTLSFLQSQIFDHLVNSATWGLQRASNSWHCVYTCPVVMGKKLVRNCQ
jgi:hypothetical protein